MVRMCSGCREPAFGMPRLDSAHFMEKTAAASRPAGQAVFGLFDAIPDDLMQFRRGQRFDATGVSAFLSLKKSDVSRIASVAEASVRYNDQPGGQAIQWRPRQDRCLVQSAQPLTGESLPTRLDPSRAPCSATQIHHRRHDEPNPGSMIKTPVKPLTAHQNSHTRNLTIRISLSEIPSSLWTSPNFRHRLFLLRNHAAHALARTQNFQ